MAEVVPVAGSVGDAVVSHKVEALKTKLYDSFTKHGLEPGLAAKRSSLLSKVAVHSKKKPPGDVLAVHFSSCDNQPVCMLIRLAKAEATRTNCGSIESKSPERRGENLLLLEAINMVTGQLEAGVYSLDMLAGISSTVATTVAKRLEKRMAGSEEPAYVPLPPDAAPGATLPANTVTPSPFPEDRSPRLPSPPRLPFSKAATSPDGIVEWNPTRRPSASSSRSERTPEKGANLTVEVQRSTSRAMRLARGMSSGSLSPGSPAHWERPGGLHSGSESEEDARTPGTHRSYRSNCSRGAMLSPSAALTAQRRAVPIRGRRGSKPAGIVRRLSLGAPPSATANESPIAFKPRRAVLHPPPPAPVSPGKPPTPSANTAHTPKASPMAAPTSPLKRQRPPLASALQVTTALTPRQLSPSPEPRVASVSPLSGRMSSASNDSEAEFPAPQRSARSASQAPPVASPPPSPLSTLSPTLSAPSPPPAEESSFAASSPPPASAKAAPSPQPPPTGTEEPKSSVMNTVMAALTQPVRPSKPQRKSTSQSTAPTSGDDLAAWQPTPARRVSLHWAAVLEQASHFAERQGDAKAAMAALDSMVAPPSDATPPPPEPAKKPTMLKQPSWVKAPGLAALTNNSSFRGGKGDTVTERRRAVAAALKKDTGVVVQGRRRTVAASKTRKAAGSPARPVRPVASAAGKKKKADAAKSKPLAAAAAPSRRGKPKSTASVKLPTRHRRGSLTPGGSTRNLNKPSRVGSARQRRPSALAAESGALFKTRDSIEKGEA